MEKVKKWDIENALNVVILIQKAKCIIVQNLLLIICFALNARQHKLHGIRKNMDNFKTKPIYHIHHLKAPRTYYEATGHHYSYEEQDVFERNYWRWILILGYCVVALLILGVLR